MFRSTLEIFTNDLRAIFGKWKLRWPLPLKHWPSMDLAVQASQMVPAIPSSRITGRSQDQPSLATRQSQTGDLTGQNGDLVPTVQGIPVLMPIHRHDEFGRPGLHWHVDYRYLAGEPSQSRVVWPETDDPDGEVKYVRMARIRETYTAEMQIPHIQAYLSGRFGGVSVGADGVCPHKGLPMMPVGPSGHRRCVGHGLT